MGDVDGSTLSGPRPTRRPGRHRHLTCVRSDGLSAVLRPLLDDHRIVAATLVDVDSGLTLDGYVDDPGEHPALADLELLGAAHADMVKASLVVAPTLTELTVGTDDGHHHLLHAVPDPHGERLVVAVVVRGAPRHVTRARVRLRAVSVEALTAGPTLARRPVDGSWVIDGTAPQATPRDVPGDDVERAEEDPVPVAPASGGAPLSAMAPHAAAPPAAAAPSATVSSVASPLLPGLTPEPTSPLVPLSDARPATARTGSAGR